MAFFSHGMKGVRDLMLDPGVVFAFGPKVALFGDGHRLGERILCIC